jgi:hypothetical protein
MNHVVAQANGAAAKSSDWLQQSVQQFFSAVNWNDRPSVIQHLLLNTELETAQTPSLFLTVNQYFGAFDWEGRNVAAPLKSSTKPVAEAKDEFTLDDFSDLF